MTEPNENDTTMSMACSRCGGLISWGHTGDCPHCGKSTVMMGFEFADDPEKAEEELLAVIEFIRNTPPNCIKGFTAERRAISESPYDATVEWAISCPCGCKSGSVIGYSEVEREGFLASPLSFRCESCDRESVFFDENLHGFNRAFDEPCEDNQQCIPHLGTTQTVECSACGCKTVDVSLTFSNPNGSGVDLEDDPEYEDRCQDFFDYFTCTTKCTKCGKSWVCTEFECA